MCGIMGYFCCAQTKPDKEKITDMFSLLQSRGTDASGYAFINHDGHLTVNKAPIRSSEMIESPEWKKLDLPPMMILHTRMKTQGCQTNNANNHPLFSKVGVALVHNGIVYNDKEIFGKKQRDAEVDSEAILQLLTTKSKRDKIQVLFERIEGSFAVAIINKSEPDKLTLIKKDNPIDIYYDSEADIIYFCSERKIMQESLEITAATKRGFNIGEKNFHFYEMENNHALIINKDGVESYKKYYPRKDSWFERRYESYRPSLRSNNMIQCPWCYSETHYNDGRLLNKCEQCGMSISEEDLYYV